MIFGVLNPEKIWHQQLVHLPTSPVYCSHFTLGNSKSHFQQYYSFILPISYVISEKNKLLLPYPLHLKNVAHYLAKIAQIFHLFHFFTCIEYQFAIRTSCGMAASCCDMGWISAEHGGWYRWSVAKKTGSMYPCRRWSLWTFVVTLLAWHSIRLTSQPVLFRTTNANPQPAHFRSTNVWRNAHTFSQMKMLCILQGNGVTFFRYGG